MLRVWLLGAAASVAGAAALVTLEASPCDAMADEPAGAHRVERSAERVTVLMRSDGSVRNSSRVTEIRAQALLGRALFPDAGDRKLLMQKMTVQAYECGDYGVVVAGTDPRLARLEDDASGPTKKE